MDIKKLAPWNWFNKEEEEGGATVPVKRADNQVSVADRTSKPNRPAAAGNG